MRAINLLDSKYQYEVKQYKSVLYLEQDNNDSETKYYILKESHEKESDIDYGYLYSYYKIGNKLYTGFWSNVYKYWHKQNEQLSLFDI